MIEKKDNEYLLPTDVKRQGTPNADMWGCNANAMNVYLLGDL